MPPINFNKLLENSNNNNEWAAIFGFRLTTRTSNGANCNGSTQARLIAVPSNPSADKRPSVSNTASVESTTAYTTSSAWRRVSAGAFCNAVGRNESTEIVTTSTA